MKFSSWEQGTPEWLAERRGVITASRFRDALDTLKSTGKPSSKSTLYAMDLARERCGGTVMQGYVNAAMRMGTAEEPEARRAYELERGVFVEQVGFFKTDDGEFGVSVDGLTEDDEGEGGIEIKTLVSSDTLFRLLVEKDYSDYLHQITAPMWLLHRKWWDLVMWTPDLSKKLHVVRFHRDENFIEKMESGLVNFSREVNNLTNKLRGAL